MAQTSRSDPATGGAVPTLSWTVIRPLAPANVLALEEPECRTAQHDDVRQQNDKGVQRAGQVTHAKYVDTS